MVQSRCRVILVYDLHRDSGLQGGIARVSALCLVYGYICSATQTIVAYII